MSSKLTNSNDGLRDGLYRIDHPDSDIFLPGSLWKPSMATLGNNVQYLCEVNDESDEPYIANQPIKPVKSNGHTTYTEPDGSTTITITVPCSRFTATYEPAITSDFHASCGGNTKQFFISTTKGEDQCGRSGSSIIPRANCQTGANSAILVPDDGLWTADSQRNSDARSDNDGSTVCCAVTTNTP